jgi:hypothetical protein
VASHLELLQRPVLLWHLRLLLPRRNPENQRVVGVVLLPKAPVVPLPCCLAPCSVQKVVQLPCSQALQGLHPQPAYLLGPWQVHLHCSWDQWSGQTLAWPLLQ